MISSHVYNCNCCVCVAFALVVRPQGTPATGERYQLDCSVTWADGNVSTITWEKSGIPITSNGSGIFLGQQRTDGPTSTLVLLLHPLSTSHEGNYTCETVIETRTYSYTYPVVVTASKQSIHRNHFPHYTLCCSTGELNVAIRASPPGLVHQVFSSVNLTCTVSGIHRSPLSYRWTSTCTGSNCFVLSVSTPTVSKSSLHSVDSGNHTCLVTDALGNSGSATVEIQVTGKRGILS